VRLLIVSATTEEVGILLSFLGQKPEKGKKLYRIDFYGIKVDVLITGVGSIFTLYGIEEYLCKNSQVDFAINVGLCGSFPESKIGLLKVVNIRSEQFGDLGVVEGGRIKTLFDLGLVEDEVFEQQRLVNDTEFEGLENFVDFTGVDSITVCSISSYPEQIERRSKRFGADVENMEGAAFFYVMKKRGIKFLEIRSVSNFVERRNKERWEVMGAISKLNEQMKLLVLEIAKRYLP